MIKTPYYSYRNGELAKGCKLCIKGEKLVLFVTGLCRRGCFYCPISDYKKRKDVVFANEWETSDIRDIIKEAELCSSKGAGITGGDPLLKVERVVKFIKALKKKFGKRFHIHLYTPFQNVTENKFRKLYDAGLDEIRFHPNILDDTNWERVDTAKKFKWDIGVEIPVIPGYSRQTSKLIEYFKDKVDFFNLNELEMADARANKLSQLGFVTKDNLSYGIKGSEEIALRLLKRFSKLRIHYCTVRLKDRVQLKERIKKRAKNTALKSDIITSDGTLLRGAVYLEESRPGAGYERKLLRLRKNKGLLLKLKKLQKKIKKKTVLDKEKMRLLCSPKDAQELSKEIPNCAIVEEYPTKDKMIVEVEFLS